MKKFALVFLLLSSLAFAQKTSVTAINNIRMSDRYNFQQFPTDDLSTPGAGKTITLKKGILGLPTTNSTIRPYRVYIATVGTAELALVTGGTYTEAAGGTITVTTANAHTAGYTVQSSTGGVQEAINDACGISATIIRNGPCNVIIPPTPPPTAGTITGYDVYDTIFFQAKHGLLSGYGATLNCRMRGPCLQVGDLLNSNDFNNSKVEGISFRSVTSVTPGAAFQGSLMVDQVRTSGVVTVNTAAPHGLVTGDRVTQMFTDYAGYWGDVPSITVTSATQYTYTRSGSADIGAHTGPGVVALTYVAILDNGNHTSFKDIQSESTFLVGAFNHFFDVWDDENMLITHFSNNGISTQGNVNWAGSLVFSGGNNNLPSTSQAMAPVITIEAANMTVNAGSGVTIYDGNGLHVNNSVIQAQGLWQVYNSTTAGNFQGASINNIYSEPSLALNPASPAKSPWPGLGVAGLIAGPTAQGGIGYTISGGQTVQGLLPTSGSGATTYAYFIVAKDVTSAAQTSPMPAMFRKENAAGTQIVSWPRVGNGNHTITYDVLRVPVPNGVFTSAAGGFVAPYTGGCGGTGVGICGSIVTNQAQGAGFIQTFTDDTSVATTNYPTVALGTLPVVTFWPGAIVTANSTIKGDLEVQAIGVGLNGTAAMSLTQCTAYGMGVFGGPNICTGSAATSNNSIKAQSATFMTDYGITGGGIAQTKGRLNFIGSPSASTGPHHIITLVDSSPAKTLATTTYRPVADANDTWIGTDNAAGATAYSGIQMAMGAPVGISMYIGNIGDNASYKERLSATLKTFTVPITTNSNVTMTAGTLNVSAATKTIPWTVGNGVPSNANCTIDGQVYFQSDSVNLGQQLWFCKTNVWTLMTGGGGGGGTWNTISSPGGNQSLSMGNFSSTWTGGTALTNPILTITDPAGDTYTGNLMQVTVPATSTATGLGVTVPTGGTAITAQAGSSGYAIKVPFGQGNIGFNRLVSTSANAPTSGCSICFGATDTARYWNGSLATAMVLIGGGGAGPVHVGDTPGIDIAGTLTSATTGQGLTFVPLAATGNGAGGDLTLTAGNGAGTGKNGIVRLAGGTGGTGGRGLVSLGTSGAGATWTNDNTNPPTQYGPVCVTTAGIAQQCGAGALEGLVGICMDNCTNTGSSIVVSNQWARGTFDGATVTSGDYVSASTTPGLLTDVGPSPNTTAMTIGIVGSNISATDWNVFVFPQSPVVSLSNVVVTNPSGGNVILSASPTQTPLTLQAAATGTADIFLVKKFDGTTAMKVDTNGILTVGTGAGTITSTQFVSATANPASNAANNILRLAKTDFVAWRNNGNSQDLLMGVNNSDFLSLDRMPGITINPNHGSFATTLTVTAPGQNQNLTIPDVGAATGTFVFTDFTQTLSKKTISDAVTFTNIATPPAPAAGFLKLYAKANQICTETSAAVEACGAGGGGATVTSVGQTVNGGATSGIFTLSGGPVTTSGTLDTAIAGTSGGVPYFSSGTVLSSSAALTSNSPVLGGGAGATPKTIAGITSDGTSVITVGVAGSTVGGIDFKNATSGTISVRPTTGALGAVTWTIPAVTDTAVGLAATQTLTNKTLTLPVIASVSNSGTMTIPTGTDTLVGKATTDVFTNKTYDADAGTGNVLISSSKLYLAAGGCQNATASLLWDTPTTNPAVAACDTGTNVQKGIANFADGANTLSMSTNFLLPSDWSGAVDAKFRWFTTATTGNIVWQIATICVADGETSDPAYNTASTVTDAAKGTTLQDNDATITGITTTGCAAGEMMYVKVFRDPSNGSDTLSATGSLRGVELTLRRTQ